VSESRRERPLSEREDRVRVLSAVRPGLLSWRRRGGVGKAES
jgi:hypothetical protein